MQVKILLHSSYCFSYYFQYSVEFHLRKKNSRVKQHIKIIYVSFCKPFDVDSTIVARSTEGVGWTTIRSELSNEFVVTGVTAEGSILITDIMLSVNC